MRLLELASRILPRLRKETRYLTWEWNLKFRKELTIHTQQGIYTVPAMAHDSVVKSLYLYGSYERELMTLTANFVHEQMGRPRGQGTILDIGAHMGITSIGMLTQKAFDKAIAIEPAPKSFSFLQRNIRQNGLEDRIIPLNYAVTDRQATVEFELFEKNPTWHRVRSSSTEKYPSPPALQEESNWTVIQVPGDTVDHLLEDVPETFSKNINLMWVDAEGYEGYIFRGAEKLIATGIPVISELLPYSILRTGMSLEAFHDIARTYWTHYWVIRRGKFVRYPIETLDIFFEELGVDGGFDNVIFTS